MQMSDYHQGSSSSSNTYQPACLLYIRFHSDDNISEIWALVIEVKVKRFEVRSRWIILIIVDWKNQKQGSQSEVTLLVSNKVTKSVFFALLISDHHMNKNATGRPSIHGPFLTFVFRPFLLLEVFWNKNGKKHNGEPFFGPHCLNVHCFWLKFWMNVAKIPLKIN